MEKIAERWGVEDICIELEEKYEVKRGRGGDPLDLVKEVNEMCQSVDTRSPTPATSLSPWSGALRLCCTCTFDEVTSHTGVALNTQLSQYHRE